MTLTVGKRGRITIPKALREQCHMDEGAQVEVSVENNTLVLTPSVHCRTRLDENLDEMRAMLTEKGVTQEAAMQALREARNTPVGLPDRRGG